MAIFFKTYEVQPPVKWTGWPRQREIRARHTSEDFEDFDCEDGLYENETWEERQLSDELQAIHDCEVAQFEDSQIEEDRTLSKRTLKKATFGKPLNKSLSVLQRDAVRLADSIDSQSFLMPAVFFAEVDKFIDQVQSRLSENIQKSSETIESLSSSEFFSDLVDGFRKEETQLPSPLDRIVDVNLTPRLLVSPFFRRALPFFLCNYYEKSAGPAITRH